MEIKSAGVCLAISCHPIPEIPFNTQTQNYSFEDAKNYYNSLKQSKFFPSKNNNQIYSCIPYTLNILIRNVRAQAIQSLILSIKITNNQDIISQDTIEVCSVLGPSCTSSTSYSFVPTQTGKAKVILSLQYGPSQSRSSVNLSGNFEVLPVISLISSLNTDTENILASIKLENLASIHLFNVFIAPYGEASSPVSPCIAPHDSILTYLTLSQPKPSITVTWYILTGSKCEQTFFLPMPRKEPPKPIEITLNQIPPSVLAFQHFSVDLVIQNKSNSDVEISLSIACSKATLTTSDHSTINIGKVKGQDVKHVELHLIGLNEGKLAFPKLNFMIDGKKVVFSPLKFVIVSGFSSLIN